MLILKIIIIFGTYSLKKIIMKKTLTLIAICLTTSLFSQLENMTIKNVITISHQDYLSETETITVPDGKWWVLNLPVSYNVTNFKAKFNGLSQFDNVLFHNYNYNGVANDKVIILSEGTEIFFITNSNASYYAVQIWEYNAPVSHTGTLAYEEIEDTLNKGIKLFPNPTTSKIALNSSKDYKIEIFDMAGNKVMETSGNSIDMSVLSSAMYIVKAFDKATKETESYKVVKN